LAEQLDAARNVVATNSEVLNWLADC